MFDFFSFDADYFATDAMPLSSLCYAFLSLR